MTSACGEPIPTPGTVCAYPPCDEPAVAFLTRPFIDDGRPMALCVEHHERGVALTAALKLDHKGHHHG